MISPRALVLVLVYLFLWELMPSTNHHRYYDIEPSTTTTVVVMADVTDVNVPDGVCHEDMECWESEP